MKRSSLLVAVVWVDHSVSAALMRVTLSSGRCASSWMESKLMPKNDIIVAGPSSFLLQGDSNACKGELKSMKVLIAERSGLCEGEEII